MKCVKDVAAFVERLLSIVRQNVWVGATLETAISYDQWKAVAGLAGKAADRTTN